MEKQQQPRAKEEKSTRKPDPATLHTTDPQEHMEGPISSAVQKVKEEVEENDDEDANDSSKEKRD